MDNIDLNLQTLLNNILKMKKYIFYSISAGPNILHERNKYIRRIKKKENSTTVHSKSVGYDGFGEKKGKIPEKSLVIEKYDFAVGLISKNIPIGFNQTDEIIGVSSAYYGFNSEMNIISWYFYFWLKNNYKKYIKNSSRQGQGFNVDLFLNEKTKIPKMESFEKYEKIFIDLIEIENSILDIKNNVFWLKKELIKYLIN